MLPGNLLCSGYLEEVLSYQRAAVYSFDNAEGLRIYFITRGLLGYPGAGVMLKRITVPDCRYL